MALLVEYCGAGFHGSQYQPAFPTVQQTIEEALGRLNLMTSAVSFAGRTDAGVHARGQIAHVDVKPEGLANVPELVAALNAVLPDTVAVRQAELNAGHAFNSRRDASAKWYRYVIYNSETRSVWTPMGATHHRHPLDENAMNKAAALLLGTHDFGSFKGADTDVTDNICAVSHASVRREGETLTFDIVADRFLYKMVRNIVGQLIRIGQHGLPPETMLTVLEARDRTQAASIARPEGLSLMAVQYHPPFNFFETDPLVRQMRRFSVVSETIQPTQPMESMQNENLFRKAS